MTNPSQPAVVDAAVIANLRNCTTPKPGFLLHVWGGFWNEGLAERLLGTASEYFWYDTLEERDAAAVAITTLAKQQARPDHQSVAVSKVDGPQVMTRPVARMNLVLDGHKYPIVDDFPYGYPEGTAEYMWHEGNYSCDCNKSMRILSNYPDSGVEHMECGDTILIEDFTITQEP